MNKCPKCNGFFFDSSTERIGTGYPTKLIRCSSCFTVVGAILCDEVQEMIEILYNKAQK